MLSSVLASSIAHAADPCGIVYTERQLYYELCRSLLPPPGLAPRTTFPTLAVGIVPTLALALRRHWHRAGRWTLAYMLMVGALRGLRLAPFTLPPPLSYARFADLLAAYRSTVGEPAGLLANTTPTRLTFQGDAPDLTDYGLPHLLICQHDEIAQMLLANWFHLETRCAVLSLASATPLPEPLCAMLARTPEARVYLLHDASRTGLSLVPRLRERLQVPDEVRVTAIGLRPAHALQLHLVATRPYDWAEPHAELPTYLTPRERAWLHAGWCAEIAAIKPSRLLLALRRIILDITPPTFRLPDWRRERAIGFMTWPEQ